MNKELRNTNKIDLETPRLVWHKQKVEETSKHSVLGGHKTCSIEKIKVLSDAIECCHSVHEKVCVTSATTDDSFKDYWMKELNSQVAGSSKDSQRTLPKSNKGNFCGREKVFLEGIQRSAKVFFEGYKSFFGIQQEKCFENQKHHKHSKILK